MVYPPSSPPPPAKADVIREVDELEEWLKGLTSADGAKAVERLEANGPPSSYRR